MREIRTSGLMRRSRATCSLLYRLKKPTAVSRLNAAETIVKAGSAFNLHGKMGLKCYSSGVDFSRCTLFVRLLIFRRVFGAASSCFRGSILAGEGDVCPAVVVRSCEIKSSYWLPSVFLSRMLFEETWTSLEPSGREALIRKKVCTPALSLNTAPEKDEDLMVPTSLSSDDGWASARTAGKNSNAMSRSRRKDRNIFLLAEMAMCPLNIFIIRLTALSPYRCLLW